jgi:hypothetical protein
MGSSRDFITATIADAIAPSFKRPVEDIIYETLDRRQIPTRTDFKELRDIINNLRSQTTGSTNGIKKLKEGLDDIEESFCGLETNLVDLTNAVENMKLQNQFLKDSLSEILHRIGLLEKGSPPKTINVSKNSPGQEECRVGDCNSPQRAWGFCAPHYAKWRRGTLLGFVPYDGNVNCNEAIVALTDYKGLAFQIKENEVWIEGKCVSNG